MFSGARLPAGGAQSEISHVVVLFCCRKHAGENVAGDKSGAEGGRSPGYLAQRHAHFPVDACVGEAAPGGPTCVRPHSKKERFGARYIGATDQR